MNEEKKRLRLEIKFRLKELDEKDLEASNRRISEKVLNSREYRDSKCIFTYVGIGKEPDTKEIIRAALADGKTVLVPKCRKAPEMDPIQINSLSELRPGTMGIPEPVSDNAYSGTIDLIIVPCVTASKDGSRLGHGGGYYDRFLSLNKDSVSICLCHELLLTEKIPAEQWDIKADKTVW